MSKTNDLKKLVRTQLLTVCDNVYYEQAIDKVMYPHCVFSFNTVNLSDFYRDDITMDVDVWTKGKNTTNIDTLCDDIEALFNNANLPQDTILPTFFRDTRTVVIDEDKDIKHRVLRFLIQNYER